MKTADSRRQFGQQNETLARQHLVNLGYKVVTQNYRTSLGEIDLICEIDSTLVFVEVRSRKNPTFGHPFESVDFRKRQKLRRLAEQYLQKHRQPQNHFRFDVVAVVDNKIEHLIDAFDMSDG